MYIFGDAVSGELFGISLETATTDDAVLLLSSDVMAKQPLRSMTSIYIYGDEILFSRLGSGKGGGGGSPPSILSIGITR